MREDDIAATCREMMKDELEHQKFRRLYLGIWPKTAADRWIDMSLWDDVCSNFNASDMKGLPLYVGVDLAQSDDLSAVVFVWLRPGKAYVGCHFWIPEAIATRYYEKDGVDYPGWAKDGHVTLVDGPTISSATRREIAEHIIRVAKPAQLKAVCYDPAKSGETTAILEAAKLTCVPVRQGYFVNNGVMELDRRLKERAIVIAENPVMRFCASNACLKPPGDKGDTYVIKPHANTDTNYAGSRGAKIDGIVALVTAMTESHKYAFPTAVDAWNGEVCSLSPRRPAARK